MRPIFFSTLIIFCLIYCKTSDLQPPKRHINCYIRILETEGRILSEATMTEIKPNEAALPVEVPGGIRYQGSPMDLKPNQGMTYIKAFPGKFSPEHVFSWDDAKNQRQTFTAKMANLEKFGFGATTLSRKNRAVLTWQGEPIGTGESLVLLWENAQENLTVPMEIYGAQSSPTIEFPAAKMSELVPGTWTLYLVRKRLVKANIGDVPAEAILEFYSQTDTLKITD